MSRKSPPVPKYIDTHPADLATADALAAEGLKPIGEVAALLTIRTATSERTTGLFWRSETRPA
ncbi:hypothetical protein K7W42_20425 [Deinococcus sp. HMF7604]|uniref:hypothetical protein n=1 Tax=Deinococcus betulae TaxID=2873312 RepID=UPI001CCDCA14|nr:hypothetical protein [Deinococcus betulae]MBZ9753206.1 hypothetical protein [Deinococcus betulae]